NQQQEIGKWRPCGDPGARAGGRRKQKCLGLRHEYHEEKDEQDQTEKHHGRHLASSLESDYLFVSPKASTGILRCFSLAHHCCGCGRMFTLVNVGQALSPNVTYFSQFRKCGGSCGADPPVGVASGPGRPRPAARDNWISTLQGANRPTGASSAVQGDRPTIDASSPISHARPWR